MVLSWAPPNPQQVAVQLTTFTMMSSGFHGLSLRSSDISLPVVLMLPASLLALLLLLLVLSNGSSLPQLMLLALLPKLIALGWPSCRYSTGAENAGFSDTTRSVGQALLLLCQHLAASQVTNI